MVQLALWLIAVHSVSQLLPPAPDLRLLDTATGSGSLGSNDTELRYSCLRWVGLLDIALEDAILVSLTILGLGSSGRLGCGSLAEEP